MNLRNLMLAGACSLAIGIGAAAGQDTSSKYQQWPGNDASSPAADALVQKLQKLIDQAERDKAADPQFLADLRKLVADYSNPWQDHLLSDDFRDGNYTANPTWTVSSGAFKVDTKGNNTGLRSTILAPGSSMTQSSGNTAVDILGALMNNQNQNAQQSTSNASYGAIGTSLQISNAFALRLEFVSSEKRGRIDFGPYQGPQGATAYRVAYLPGQTTDSLKLIRITPKGAVAIATYKGGLNLEDGRSHVLTWTRDRNGAMTVSLDGNSMISAADRTIGKSFDGFMLINSGGTYWVRSISIDGSRS